MDNERKDEIRLVVWNSILKEVMKSICSDTEKILYHYTSPDGLLGIIQNKQVWFGNILDMNDITEIDYSFDNVIIPKIEDSKTISAFSRKKLLDLIPKVRNHNLYFEQDGRAVAHEANIYVLSTSLNSNSHNLWNMYSKTSSRAGYAISMSVADLYTALYNGLRHSPKDKNRVASTLLWGRIIYNKTEQESIIEKFLSPLEEKIDGRDDDFKEILYENVAQGLYILSAFMKDEDFSQEQEIRFLSIVANEAFGVGSDKTPYIKFLNINGSIVSKLVMPFDISKIKKVVVSPYMLEQSHVENDLKFFLNKHGVNEFEIVIEKRKLR